MKKRRLVGILLSLVTLCSAVFAGCDLITVNRDKYLNQVVASVVEKGTKNKINIYKKDLIEAYSVYGSYYAQQSGQTDLEQVYDSILDLLVKRKIVVNQYEKLVAEGKISQTDSDLKKEKAYLYQQTLETLEAQYDSYLNQLLGTQNDDSTRTDKRVFVDYNPSAVLAGEGESAVINKTHLEQDEFEEFSYTTERDLEKTEDREALYATFNAYVNNIKSDIRKNAFNNYFNALKQEEKGLKLSTDTKEVFLREIDKIYRNEYENFCITQYSAYLKKGLAPSESNPYLDAVTVDDVLKQYSGKVRSAYTQYSHAMEDDTSAYSSAMQNDASAVYYYLDSRDATETGVIEFFQVGHILLQFGAESDALAKQEGFTDAKTYYNHLVGLEDKNSAEYTNGIANLKASIKPNVRKFDNGEWVDGSATFAEEQNAESLAAWIRDDINNRSIDKANLQDEEGKIAKFREYVYKYNDDPGQINNMTALHNYALGVNYSEKDGDKDYKAYSGYVENFTTAAIELYDHGRGQLGAVSDPVLTENGIHILIYLGKYENLFGGIDTEFKLYNNAENNGIYPIDELRNTYPNPFYSKSYFDVIYEELNVDHFSELQEYDITNLTDSYNIDYKKSNYDDLF